MRAAVFIPGIMGTRLIAADGEEELWPPTPLETQFGYERVDKLLDDGVRPGTIIRNVLCFDFYQPVLDQLNELGFANAPGKNRLIEFPYDWRLDLQDLAGQLAATLDTVEADEIYLVAHSMGGLVTRLMLESGDYDERDWFPKIRLFAALAVPHNGAPLALARVLGIDSTLGISGSDFRKIANDRRYPSGYQLLPAPGEDACWDQTVRDLSPLDIYDPQSAQALGLDSHLLARVRFVHDTLGSGPPPEHIRYFYFAGSGHETATRVNVFQDKDGKYQSEHMSITLTPDAGDGTVPLWSALPRREQKQVVINEHATVFQGTPFKRVFYRLLGGDRGPALEGVLDALEADAPDLTLSLSSPVQRADSEIEVVMAFAKPLKSLTGRLVIEKLDNVGKAEREPARVVEVQYDGPALTKLTFHLEAISAAANYRISFQGDRKAENAPVFVVSEV